MTLFETNHGYTVMDSIATSLKAIAKELALWNRMYYQNHSGQKEDSLDLKLSEKDKRHLKGEY